MEENEKDVQEVQETSEEESTEENTQEDDQLSNEDLAELKRNADASSQNYERLKKEEKKRKELEKQLEELQAQKALEDSFEHTGQDGVLKEIQSLSSKLKQMEEEKQWDSVLSKYPAIKDKREQFDEYLEDYKDIPLDKVAKLFVVENELETSSQKRKGLEKAGGGVRTVPTSGKFSEEDIKRLRETNYKEYRKQVLAGKIKF